MPDLVHLAARFLASLHPSEPSPDEVARVRAVLTPSEWTLWSAMARADRAESVATLQRLPAAIAADPRWAAAALLHDVGKTESRLGPFRRAGTTAVGWVVSRDRLGGRAGAYLRHASLGADRLRAAGARPEAVAWAATHHDPTQWPEDLIPEPVCVALTRADGERLPTGSRLPL